eukprot:790943-Ditylum_brightwellii.AAC.2
MTAPLPSNSFPAVGACCMLITNHHFSAQSHSSSVILTHKVLLSQSHRRTTVYRSSAMCHYFKCISAQTYHQCSVSCCRRNDAVSITPTNT